MSRVVKRRLYIVLAFVLSVIMVFAVIPSMPKGTQRVSAASSYGVYFLPGKDSDNGWNNQYIKDNGLNIYVYTFNDGKFRKMTEVTTDVYSVDTVSKPTGMIFIMNSIPDWPNDNWMRTADVTNIVSSGTCYYLNGNDQTGKKTVDIDNGFRIPNAVHGGNKRIYFDATFSKLTYSNDIGNYQVKDVSGTSIPSPGGNVYYYATNASRNQSWSGQMTQVGTSDLWYVDVDPAQQTRIRFTAWPNPRNEDSSVCGNGTGMVDIPYNVYSEPTFYADTGDPVVYTGGNRGGYWGNKGDIRNAEAGKNKDVVQIENGDFVPDDDIFYVNSTFYDYYSDYELNGNNRVDYTLDGKAKEFPSFRNWNTFRQLAQAMSDYYRANGVPATNTIYTGHYQPTVSVGEDGDPWGFQFKDIADTLKLLGWDENNKAFQANNNSCKSLDSNDNYQQANFYKYATQNILSNKLDANDVPVMYGTNDTELPHFNESFLTGQNSKNAVLGEVYHNVAFPFTKVYRDDDNDPNKSGLYYWSFDSAATTLKLKKNTDSSINNDYYLDTISMATVTDSNGLVTEASRSGSAAVMNDDRKKTQDERSGSGWSKNLVSSGSTNQIDLGDYPSNNYGFFPLNSSRANNSCAATYNYGFGTKLEFDFNLTSDGNINTGRAKEPITFTFSGDDDIWVFIDGKLVLDMGGDHGRTSGCINFSKDTSYQYNYSYKKDKSEDIASSSNTVGAGRVLVSEVKKSANNSSQYSNLNKNSDAVTTSMWDALGITTDEEKNSFYKSTHTLTFYYMERGMWESNMRIQFNFPMNDVLEIAKEVDTENVNTLFKNFFNEVSADFQIKNMVTHYGTQNSRVDMGRFVSQSEIRDYSSAAGTSLKPAADAKYLLNGDDTQLFGLTDEGKLLGLKNNDSASFVTEFRRGSYISIEELLDDAEKQLYTTAWSVYENGQPVNGYDSTGSKTVIGSQNSPLEGRGDPETGRGYAITDNRIEKKDNKSGGNYNQYNVEQRPEGSSIVFRSFSKPDSLANIELKTLFTNTVNTGSLVVTKAQAAGSESLNGEYSFTVTFYNIGGKGLAYSGNSNVVQEFKLNADGEWRLDGIPVGTEFSITEAEPQDGSVFDSVTSSDRTSTVSAAAARTITGAIGFDPEKDNKGEEETVTFINKKQKEVISITITKKWDNVNGVDLPSNVSFQLQRRTAAAANWTPVEDYTKFTVDPRSDKVTTTRTGTDIVNWKMDINGLDKYSDAANTSLYTYRIVEYSVYDGSPLVYDGNNYSPNYVVSYSSKDGVSADADTPALTVTNTYSAIVMPETGASPLVNFAVIGMSAVGIAFIALVIYKRKLQTANVNANKRGGR